MDGDPSLLVMEVPASIGPGGEASYAFAIPLMQRRGGLLVALPLGALDENRLVDEMTSEGEDLLGPSKSFTAELSVEEDGGSTVLIGIQCRFMVVDFSESVLEHMKDYIPEEDDLKVIVPFNEEYPNALPSMLDIPEKILEWARGDNVGRAHFYSAREEPMLAASPKAPAAKKANPKRVSNATMMDQLSALQAQVQALVVAQSAAFQPPATATGEPPHPVPSQRNRWRLDHRLLVGPSRRAADPIVPGEGPEPSHPRQTIRCNGSAIPCRGSPVLLKGARDFEFKEEGDPEFNQPEGITKHRIPSFTKEAAEVSQETKGPSSQFPVKPARAGRVKMDLDDGSGPFEFRDSADHPGCSASNKKISHRGLGTGVDFETEMTHSKWCGMLTSMVLRSRSPFAFYLQRTFRLSRSTTTSATTLFPIPVPFVGLFDRMSPTQAVRDRRTQSIRRVVYIIVYALNYWYFGGPPPGLSLLGRVPNPSQCRIYRRIENYVRSDSGMPSFRVAAAAKDSHN